jgi:hypothetical protein
MPDAHVVLPGVTAPPLTGVRRGGAQTRNALPPMAPGNREGRQDLRRCGTPWRPASPCGQRAVRE